MTETAMHGAVNAFCGALVSRDLDKIGELLADDVDCTAFGPMDIFPFFGRRHGRDGVLTMLRQMGEGLSLRTCERERSLCDGDNFAALTRVSAVQAATGRMLTFRLAMFAQVADGKLTSLRVLFDSFDLAEQVLGRPIDLSAVA